MIWSKFVISFMVGLLFVSCSETEKVDDTQQHQVESKNLIYVDELLDVYNDTSFVLVDFRNENDYIQGHIPGAINIYREDITIKDGELKGLIATKEVLENLLGEMGVGSSKLLIVYDGRGACESARFWWTMNYYGFENVVVLNGDYQLWESKGHPIDTLIIDREESLFVFEKAPKDRYYASKVDVIAALKDSSVLIVDTRTKEEYSGEILKRGAARKGRIPSSIHIDWANSIEYNESKEFKNVEALLNEFQSKGITKDKEVIFYCQSGTRSAHSVFVLSQLLGYENVKNYDGSWIEWSHDLSLQIERD